MVILSKKQRKKKRKIWLVFLGRPFSQYFASRFNPDGDREPAAVWSARSRQKKSRIVCIVPTMDRRDPVWHRQGSWGAVKERKKERKESSTRVWLGLRLLATQTARWPTAGFSAVATVSKTKYGISGDSIVLCHSYEKLWKQNEAT